MGSGDDESAQRLLTVTDTSVDDQTDSQPIAVSTIRRTSGVAHDDKQRIDERRGCTIHALNDLGLSIL